MPAPMMAAARRREVAHEETLAVTCTNLCKRVRYGGTLDTLERLLTQTRVPRHPSMRKKPFDHASVAALYINCLGQGMRLHFQVSSRSSKGLSLMIIAEIGSIMHML